MALPPDPDIDETWAQRPIRPLLGVIGTLTVSNVIANRFLADWAYVPWNCGVAAVVVSIAVKADGQDFAHMGMSRATVGRGLRMGLGLSAVIVGAYGAALALPLTRDLFVDNPSELSGPALAYKVLVEIPLGTVLLEEIAFRGVLPAMLRDRVRPSRRAGFTADSIAAGLFGLWHILPASDVSGANSIFRDTLPGATGHVAVVLGNVLATAVAGMGLSWMRNHSDSVVAPAAVHTTVNGVGSVATWVANRIF